MNLKHAPSRARRGTVLITALITLMFVAIMSMALLALTLQGLHTTRRSQSGTVAFNLAESGLDRALRWLKDQPFPPPGVGHIDPFGGEQQLDGGTYIVVIEPDPENVGSSLKRYRIVATGYSGLEEEVVEQIVRQSSFGKYAYFTDSERSAVSGGRIWFFSGDRIRGPAHSNNSGGSEFQIQWGYSPGPIFEGHLTSSGDFINFSPRAPRTEPEFAQIFLAGSRGYELGVDYVPLPNSTDIQQVAAWGSGGAYPTTEGVYLPRMAASIFTEIRRSICKLMAAATRSSTLPRVEPSRN